MLLDRPLEAPREALRRACASLDLAELTGHPFTMSQALAEVGRCYHALEIETSAEAHLGNAVRWARLAGSNDHLADLLCELAESAARVADQHCRGGENTAGCRTAGHAARDRARDHAFEASQLAGRLSDASCEARLLLRVSDVLEQCGDRADAIQMQMRALNLMGGVTPRDPSQLSGFGRLADA
jgi:hypothetical protein